MDFTRYFGTFFKSRCLYRALFEIHAISSIPREKQELKTFSTQRDILQTVRDQRDVRGAEPRRKAKK